MAFVFGRWSTVLGGCRYLPRLRGHPGELPVVPGCVREGPVVPGMRGSGGAVVVKKAGVWPRP